jgi:hypothetical protein
MEPTGLQVDLDRELILLEGQWLSRGDLASLLQKQLAALDHRVAGLALAIEQLDRAVKAAETLTVRLPAELSQRLREIATQRALPVGGVVREAVLAYLVGNALDRID